ncbi:MAG: glycoside hydrolase family 127 protein, partial [Eubacteriales bacterium]|nr:glycoside hydrolase family 127 protein [Eubacteriales bacterium]
MNIPSLSYIYPRGELAVRSAKLSARLEDVIYSPDRIFDNQSKDWPGDWEGRTILALTMLSMSTGRHPSYLDEIVAALPEHMNERGYLGEVLPEGVFNEQQLSGHGWLLRGLTEFYRFRRQDRVKSMIHNIARNLFMPAKNYYSLYPVNPELRIGGGKESGNIADTTGAWQISTDTGCAFIPIDGISAAFELLGDNEIGDLAEEMIRCFLQMDLSAIKAQTHATLTAVRGILRIYNITGNNSYLKAAERIFDLYITEGMTAGYENYNWFGRPEWTEPCAVIDSFIVAMQLYINTSLTRYLDTAQRIYYNGIGRGQRPNGGFGCNT